MWKCDGQEICELVPLNFFECGLVATVVGPKLAIPRNIEIATQYLAFNQSFRVGFSPKFTEFGEGAEK
jgi:hypothetical protein